MPDGQNSGGNTPPDGDNGHPVAVVTIEDVRTGSGGGKQETPPDGQPGQPVAPTPPPATQGGSGNGGVIPPVIPPVVIEARL